MSNSIQTTNSKTFSQTHNLGSFFIDSRWEIVAEYEVANFRHLGRVALGDIVKVWAGNAYAYEKVIGICMVTHPNGRRILNITAIDEKGRVFSFENRSSAMRQKHVDNNYNFQDPKVEEEIENFETRSLEDEEQLIVSIKKEYINFGLFEFKSTYWEAKNGIEAYLRRNGSFMLWFDTNEQIAEILTKQIKIDGVLVSPKKAENLNLSEVTIEFINREKTPREKAIIWLLGFGVRTVKNGAKSTTYRLWMGEQRFRDYLKNFDLNIEIEGNMATISDK